MEPGWSDRWESSVKFSDVADGNQGFVFFFGGGRRAELVERDDYNRMFEKF